MKKQVEPKLSRKQKIFVKEYLETGNGVQSALKAYDTKDYNTANVIAVENLQKPTVKEYLESKASTVAEVIYDLAISAENEGVKLNASKDILDRAGYRPIEKSLSLSLQSTVEPRNIENGELEAVREQFEEQLKRKLLE